MGKSARSDGFADEQVPYNGKELQQELGLDWHDYGARMYDAAIGRWHVVDPYSDLYHNISLYVFTLNNPILLVDKDGRAVTETDSSYILTGSDAVNYFNKQKEKRYHNTDREPNYRHVEQIITNSYIKSGDWYIDVVEETIVETRAGSYDYEDGLIPEGKTVVRSASVKVYIQEGKIVRVEVSGYEDLYSVGNPSENLIGAVNQVIKAQKETGMTINLNFNQVSKDRGAVIQSFIGFIPHNIGNIITLGTGIYQAEHGKMLSNLTVGSVVVLSSSEYIKVGYNYRHYVTNEYKNNGRQVKTTTGKGVPDYASQYNYR